MTAKLHTIQSLRAIAAILVLASHALLYPVAETTIAIGRLGWLGVILFFVVSGFIMVSVTGEGRFEAGRFLRRRVLRIVPLYWAVTILAALMTLFFPGLFKTMVYDTGQVIMSLFFVPFTNPATHGVHPFYKLGWTLNYEMFFYLSFALLAVLRARARVIALSVVYAGLAVTGLLLHPHDPVPAFYTSVMPLAFVAGAWLGLAYLEGRLATVSRRLVLPVAALGVGGLIEGFSIGGTVVEDQLAFVGLLMFAAAAVAVVVTLEPRLPRLSVLERLGDASYSIYLAHMFSVTGIVGIALKLTHASDPAVIALAVIAAMIGGVGLGWLTYRFIESPMLQRLRPLA